MLLGLIANVPAKITLKFSLKNQSYIQNYVAHTTVKSFTTAERKFLLVSLVRISPLTPTPISTEVLNNSQPKLQSEDF